MSFKSLINLLVILSLLASGLYFSFAINTAPAFAADPPKKHGAESKKAPKKGDKKPASKKAKKKEEVVAAKEAVKSDEPVNNLAFDKELAAVSSVDAVLLIDASRSMLRTDPQRLRNQGAKLFLRFLSEGDRVGIIQFDRAAAVVADLAPIPLGDGSQLDGAIDNIPVEGNFTNLRAAIVAASEMLSQRGRPDAVKCIILLSDGKMDPHPSDGVGAEMSDLTIREDLPKLASLGAKLYTLALSPEADKELLARFATDAGGQSFYTPDASSIHQKFSDLFLVLKKPQMLPIESGGFEIDQGVKEATFYIARKVEGQEVSLLNPQAKEVRSTDLMPGLRWYRGQLFDVVTIANPLPGRWGVKGLDDVEGFATLVTDLRLQVRWPEKEINAGDTVRLAARLAEGDKVFEAPAIDDAIFYTYRIVDSSGATLIKGTLNDKGESGDETAGDRIFGTEFKLEEEGEFRVLVGVTAPTFNRSQQIPFRIAGQAITLELIPPDEFGHHTARFKATLSKFGLSLKDRKVKIAARSEDAKDAKALTIDEPEEGQAADEEFYADTAQLKAGQYQIFATLSGTDAKKKAQKFESNTIEFTAEQAAEAEEPEEEGTPWILYLSAIFVAVAWSTGTAFFALKSFSVGSSSLDKVTAYEIPPELEAQLQAIRDRVSQERRAATADDLAIIAALNGGPRKGAQAGSKQAKTEPSPDQAISSADEVTEPGPAAEAESSEAMKQTAPADTNPIETESTQPEGGQS